MPSTSKKRLFSQFSDLTKGDNLKAHGYKAEILEDEVEHFARNRGTGVTFRFRPMERHELPDDMRRPFQMEMLPG